MNMSRYKHFDDELSAGDIAEAAVLPELDVDEPHQLEFKPQLRNYAASTYSTASKLNLNYLKTYLEKRTRLERYLLSITMLLAFVVFVAGLILYYGQPEKKQPEQMCLTSACIEVSSTMHAGMNESVDPCDDFHEFVCGRWVKSNIIPKGYSSWSTTKELSRKNLILLRNILEQQPPADKSRSTFSAEYEAMKFYQSCMNISEIERQQIQPLERLFKETFNFTLKQWIDIDQNRTWEQLFVRFARTLSAKYGFSYLFPISIGPDDKNSTWNVLHVSDSQSAMRRKNADCCLM